MKTMAVQKLYYFLLYLILLLNLMNVESAYTQNNNLRDNSSYIALKSDTILYGGVRYRQDESNNILIIYNNTLILKLDEIDSVYTERGFFIVYKKMVNIEQDKRYDNLFLKRKAGGKISVYSQYNPLGTKENRNLYQYFSLKSTYIQELNYDNLKASLSDDEESMRIILDYNFYKSLFTRLLWIGFTSSIYGFFSEGAESNMVGCFGLSCIVGSTIPFILKANKLEKAIDIYNSRD